MRRKAFENLYSVREENKLHFNKDFEVHISDYNNDSINEISVGQDIEVSDKNVKVALGKKAKTKKEKNIKSLQEYYLWNIEGNDLRRASEPIYLTGKSDNSANSCEFKIPENTTGVIKSKIAGNKMFYVWDTDKKLFVKKELSKAE